MARDYKNRAQRKSKSSRESIAVWKWMLITALIISFVVFLVYLRTKGADETKAEQSSQSAAEKKTAKIDPKNLKEPVKQEKKPEPKPKTPHFEFYTILPDKEVVIPEYEIKTRTREERVGKAKESQYILQAGSFKTYKEADQLRAKLALMGIESKVERAKVGDVTWNRVKMGPFSQMASVDAIRSRLRKNGVDVMVTELGGKKAAETVPKKTELKNR